MIDDPIKDMIGQLLSKIYIFLSLESFITTIVDNFSDKLNFVVSCIHLTPDQGRSVKRVPAVTRTTVGVRNYVVAWAKDQGIYQAIMRRGLCH